MTTAAIGNYDFAPMDSADKFPAPLLYFGWEDHLMMCAPYCVPFPPNLVFGDMVRGPFADIYGYHPDFAKIDWDKAEWFKSGKPWKPDYTKSLADNGLKHKDVIRFRTPGLTGLKGSCH